MKDFAKRYASQLDKEFRKGFTCALALVLLGYYNKVDKYIEDEEKQGQFFQEWETEVNRIIQEELNENIKEGAELVTHYIEEIRSKWHIHDPMEDFK